MKTLSSTFLLSFVFALIFSVSWAALTPNQEDFLECLLLESQNSSSISNVTYTPNNSSYRSILDFGVQNLRFISPDTPRPLVIVTPVNESQIPPVVVCSKLQSLQIRVRSGGHDFEGLSYVSEFPFVLIDLINLRTVTIDVQNRTAWIQAGTTVGELYYAIANSSGTLAFPGGTCPTVGVGGLFSGGGWGFLSRKYGYAADNVIDARLIDVNGSILDRNSMGDDVFWAIRGGGGSSFGVISAWKVNLVVVPSTVTVFSVNRTLEQNATNIIHQWQSVAYNIDDDVFIRILTTNVNSTQDGNITVRASFDSLFLGGVDTLIPLLQENFPELGLMRENCTELSWIESVLFFSGATGEPLEILLDRSRSFRSYFKGKSDIVQEPISENGLEGIWERYREIEAGAVLMEWIPLGGRISEIPASEIPIPYRAGNLYIILYEVFWEGETTESEPYISWIRSLYSYMASYVSMLPRGAYYNYRDLDIGVNNYIEEMTNYAQSDFWGFKYFNNNFDRLVQAKTMIDPENFFNDEQTIPPLSSSSDI